MKYSSSDSTKGKNAIKRVEVRTKTLITQKASHISASECENDHEWAGLFSQVHFHNLFYTAIEIEAETFNSKESHDNYRRAISLLAALRV